MYYIAIHNPDSCLIIGDRDNPLIIIIRFTNTNVSTVNNYGYYTGIILCMGWANERRRHIVTSSLIGSAHVQDDPGLYTGYWSYTGLSSKRSEEYSMNELIAFPLDIQSLVYTSIWTESKIGHHSPRKCPGTQAC